MFARLVYESFRRQKRRKLLAGAAIALGVTVATAMIAVATDIGDKINRELRTIGANLIVTPQEDTLDVEIGGVNLKPPSDGAFLNEADLPKIKGTFWHNNITGFAPMLPVSVMLQRDGKTEKLTLLGTYFAKKVSFGKEQFNTGVRSTHHWWKVSGAWPDDDSRDVLLGERLAARLSAKPGDELTFSGRLLHVTGILSTGGSEDEQIVAPLALAQEILGKPGAVRRVYVSALTKPEDALARRDPRSMSGAIYDRWYCSPYPQSIAFQLQEAIPHSHAEQIRQVAQNEGAVLDAHRGPDLSNHAGGALCFSSGSLGRDGYGHFRAWCGSGIDEGSGRREGCGRVYLFCRSYPACFDRRFVGFRRRWVAGAPDWPLDLQFGDRNFACALARDPRDRGDRYFCGKRRRYSQCGASRSCVCPARSTVNAGFSNMEQSHTAEDVSAGRAHSPHTSMFLRMLVRAALLRRGRAAAALFAMVVAAAVATAMLNLYVDVQAKLRREFRNYGANILVVGKDGASLPADALAHVEGTLAGRGVAAPFALVVARTSDGQPLVVAGADFDRVKQLDRWWSVSNWPSSVYFSRKRRAKCNRR